jgi:hypothetical protein
MRLFLACCLTIFSGTVGLAENNSKPFVESCNDLSMKGFQRHEMTECIAIVSTLMVVGPYLREEVKFCPNRPILGMGAVNRYVKAHPDILKADAPNMAEHVDFSVPGCMALQMTVLA